MTIKHSADSARLRGSVATTLHTAAASTGISDVVDLGCARCVFALQTVVTGSPATVSCKLQGSLDGVNFVDLATSSSTTGDMQFAVDKPVQFLRVNLVTLSGGTSPTVTTTIAAV